MMDRVRLALRLPPRVLARRVSRMACDRIAAARLKFSDTRRSSYASNDPGSLQPRLRPDSPAPLSAHRGWIIPLADRHREGQFDLLGSGWASVRHGLSPVGVDGHVHAPGLPVEADSGGDWLAKRVNPANAEESRRLWRLVSGGYRPIDWQLDFKSGYRWSEKTWYSDVPYGHRPGIDIKVPWELGRLQHLVVFAWAHALEGARTDAYRQAFRDQVLDFVAANPPRFGVQWRCTMDVAIRAANLALAWDLFHSAGAEFDAPFLEALRRALLDHGRHIAANLEWYPEGRGNHFLANVAGLAFTAAYLPPSAETDPWLAFAARALTQEIEHQFLPDGANFEASIAYHRLSGEMCVHAAALLMGLSAERLRAIEKITARDWPVRRVPFPAQPPIHRRAEWASERLSAMADFTRGATKPRGRIAQIGDNDSGRFIRAQPVNEKGDGEDFLDHRALIGAIGAIVTRPDLIAAAGPFDLDGWIVGGLGKLPAPSSPTARLRAAVGTAMPGDLPPARQTIVLAPPGGSLRDELTLAAFPDFGLYLFRSRRLWLAVRCGPIGQNGRGGHAHNDQLTIELSVDGADWLADPGTCLYTPAPEKRNAYRSVFAHAAPRCGAREPGRLDLGLFWLGDDAKAVCRYFGPEGFCGDHVGFGFPVRRRVVIADDRIEVIDSGCPNGKATAIVCPDPESARQAFGLALPFSGGYGLP